MSKIKVPLFLLLSAISQAAFCSENPMTESVMIRTDIDQLESQLKAKKEALANTAKARKIAHLAEIQSFDASKLAKIDATQIDARLENMNIAWMKEKDNAQRAEKAYDVFFAKIEAASDKYEVTSESQKSFLRTLGLRRLGTTLKQQMESKESKRTKNNKRNYMQLVNARYMDTLKVEFPKNPIIKTGAEQTSAPKSAGFLAWILGSTKLGSTK